MIIVYFYRVLVVLVNCECDIYLCRECSGPGIDGAGPGLSAREGRRAGRPISDTYVYMLIMVKTFMCCFTVIKFPTCQRRG